MTQAASVGRSTLRRRIAWLCGLLVLTVAGLAGGWWYRVNAEERDYQEALAETDRLHPGWRLADIEAARVKIPDECNSALVVARVSKGLDNSAGAGVTLLAQSARLWPDVPLKAEQVAEMRQCMTTLASAARRRGV